MKLYQYLHCPYCLRARMTANYMNVALEYVYLLNDDEATCYQLINAKMVPILQFDDGSAMGESLDIVNKLLELGDSSKFVSPAKHTDAINQFLDASRTEYNRLYFPRNVLVDLPEFATQSARDYFQHKKEKQIGISFAEAISQTPDLLDQLHQTFNVLPAMTLGEQLSMDDILLYPFLRNLTLVKGINFPVALKLYIKHIAALTNTETFFDLAV